MTCATKTQTARTLRKKISVGHYEEDGNMKGSFKSDLGEYKARDLAAVYFLIIHYFHLYSTAREETS